MLGSFVLGKKPSLLLSVSVTIVVFGCIVAGKYIPGFKVVCYK